MTDSMTEASGPLTDARDGCRIAIRVIPRARRSTLDGVRDGALVVRLAAPPVDGAANIALIDLLARTLDMPRSALTVVSGARSRHKVVAVSGGNRSAVATRLGCEGEGYCTASKRGGTPSASSTKS